MIQENEIAFDRFHLVKRLAYGSFSLVFLATDQETNEEVALKIEILPENPCPLIAHEFAVSQHLPHSSFVCNIFNIFQDQNHFGLSMEILMENLANIRRKRERNPSISLLLNITIQCLKGLKILHDSGIVHSDVKPSNFAVKIIENDFQVVTFDFGLSSYENEDISVTTFRNKLDRNPRYIALHTHNTGEWTTQDDIESLIYSISDFWNNELPWDGRTTSPLVLEIKNGIDLHTLLPQELYHLVEYKDEPVQKIINALEQIEEHIPRNIDEDLHYLLDPKDPGLKPKLVKYVFDKNAELKFTNQHSA